MAVRLERGAGRQRARRGRARPVLLAVALYLGAGALATAPALKDAHTHFLGYGVARPGVVTPGDHLQTAYNLWLPGHQVERAAAPWLDPYSFQPEVQPRVNFAGWPFGLVWWPLDLFLDTVGAWNAFVLLSYAGAGGLAALWLRSLGLGLGAALVGGLAFALAPYRVAQSTGHLLGPISMLLPLSLWAVEARRDLLAAVAIASIPLSGQVHLALGAIPFFVAYALVRRGRRGALPGGLAAVAAGLLVWATTLRGAAGRPFAEVERYSAHVGDLLSRDVRQFEAFVFLGWLVPLAALAGLVVLARERGRLAAVLGLGALVPALLAFGGNLPGYEALWRHSPLHSTRVPERLMPIACLAVAALAGIAVDHVSWRHAALVAAALVALDLRAGVGLYDALNADERAAAYRAMGQPGRVLDVPVRPPEAYGNSVYLYYTIKEPRERPLGYSTSAPRAAVAVAGALRAQVCTRGGTRLTATLARLGVKYVVLHPRTSGSCAAARAALARAGFSQFRLAAPRDAPVLLLARRRPPPSH